MSNGLTFELYKIFLRNFQDLCQMTRQKGLQNFMQQRIYIYIFNIRRIQITNLQILNEKLTKKKNKKDTVTVTCILLS